MGVLNRIALCYTFGGLLFIFCNRRVMVAVAVALLLGYWAMLELVPFPDVRPTPGGDSVITKESRLHKRVATEHGQHEPAARLLHSRREPDGLPRPKISARTQIRRHLRPRRIFEHAARVRHRAAGNFHRPVPAQQIRAGREKSGLSHRRGRGERGGGLALGIGIARHQKNLDLILRPRRRRLQRDAARRCFTGSWT